MKIVLKLTHDFIVIKIAVDDARGCPGLAAHVASVSDVACAASFADLRAPDPAALSAAEGAAHARRLEAGEAVVAGFACSVVQEETGCLLGRA